MKNKKMITDMYVLVITTVIFYIGIVLLASYTLKEGTLFGIIVALATTILVIVCFYSLRLEIDAGYYECKNCHYRYVPNSYWKVMISPHIDTTRYLKCPKCGKRSWSKKVMSKGDNK